MATKKGSGAKKKLKAAAALAGSAVGDYFLSGKRGARNRAAIKKLAKKAESLARKGASKLERAGKTGSRAANKALKRWK